MTLLAKKTGCEYTAGKRKSPLRAIEKMGLAIDQWHAQKLRDVVRGMCRSGASTTYGVACFYSVFRALERMVLNPTYYL
jgi:hypothetical protein